MTADRAQARRQGFDVTTTANGDLQARNQVELRNKLEQTATIKWIIAEGTSVKKGDLLCELNADDIQRSIDEEKPRLASARSDAIAAENEYQIQLNDNATSLRRAELDLELAQLALRQWRSGDALKRRQDLELRLATAELELERLAEKFVRSQELLAEGFLSKDERDRDEVDYIRAISTYQTAILDLRVFDTYEFVREDKQKVSDVDQRRAEVERVRLNNEIQLASRDADRQNRREQVTLLENRLKKLEQQLADAKITAPQDGLVVYSTSVEGMRWGGNDGALQIGQQIYPNNLIIALPDTRDMIAAVRVHEAVAGRVRPGQDVTIRVDAAGGKTFQGTVDSVSVMAESGGWRDPNLREYTVRVSLLNASVEDGLKPAMRVEARIILDRVPETLTVPVQALFSEGAVQFVYQPQGQRFVRVPVRVGRRSETTAEIAAGLSENDIVLLRTPNPGEVLARDWDPQQLATAGYRRSDDGTIVAERRGGPPGGRRGGPPGAGAAPGTTPAADAPKAATPEVTPTAAPATDTPAAAPPPTPQPGK